MKNACSIQNMCIFNFLYFSIFSWSNSDSSLFYLTDFLLILVLVNIAINWYVLTTWQSVGILYDKRKLCTMYVQVIKYAFTTALWHLQFSNCFVAQFTYVYTYLLISNIWNHYHWKLIELMGTVKNDICRAFCYLQLTLNNILKMECMAS